MTMVKFIGVPVLFFPRNLFIYRFLYIVNAGE